MEQFKECNINDIQESFTNLIGNRYALITVADNTKVNMMTASWGTMGIMWSKNIVNMVVRPSRFSYNFLIENDYFTLNFLTEGNEDVYRLCGTKSGRECDKVKETGLETIEIDKSMYAFDKSEYVFVCKKLYSQPMDKQYFIDADFAEKTYPNEDIHTMFIAEIEKIYVKNC